MRDGGANTVRGSRQATWLTTFLSPIETCRRPGNNYSSLTRTSNRMLEAGVQILTTKK